VRELAVDYSAYVRRVHFRRRLLGYHPGEVDQHLRVVSGWFSLTGLDELLEERSKELHPELESRVADAHREASRILADARREADEIRAAAEEDARAVVERARRQAELERRGRSRIGRPIGQAADDRQVRC
jgi:DivIVA domain-containing protein